MTTTDPSRQPAATTGGSAGSAVSALAGYLDTVTAELASRRIPVVDSHVHIRPLLSARIRLARYRHCRHVGRCRIILDWTEDHGWAVMLHPPGRPADDTPLPWRYLHLALVVDPAAVADFTAALLRGDELGMPYPARFRTRGRALHTVITNLTAHIGTESRPDDRAG